MTVTRPRPHRFISPCRIDTDKGNRRHRCSEAHADLVHEYRQALYLQTRRAEQATGEYPRELGRYFGTDGQGPGVEVRLTFKRYLTAPKHGVRQEQQRGAA